ncbi:MAG: hypothetical protein ACYDHM_00155 [Acidiferrobacterales bacterium]
MSLKRLRWVFGLTVLAAASGMPACSQVSPRAPAIKLGSHQIRVPGEYLVTLAPGTSTEVIAALYGRFKIRRIRALGDDTFLMAIGKDPGPDRIERLRFGNQQIRAVEPNLVYHALPSIRGR